MKKKLLVASCWLLVLFIQPAFADGDKKLNVVASFSIIADMTREVAGDKIELKTLVGANGDAHIYQPTPDDVKTIAAADLVLINGLGFEGWMERLIQSSDYKGKVVTLSEGVKTINTAEEHHDKHDSHHHGSIDPHAWQDLANGKIYVDNIKNALLQIDKKNSVEYVKNASLYKLKLEEMDLWIKSQFSVIPEDRRVIVTTHDAFNYFAKAYGIKFISAMGINTEAQASASDLAKLIDNIKSQKVTALFLENVSDPRMITQLEQDTGAIVGGTLYSDSLSAANEPAATYLAMFKHNVSELIKAMRNEKK